MQPSHLIPLGGINSTDPHSVSLAQTRGIVRSSTDSFCCSGCMRAVQFVNVPSTKWKRTVRSTREVERSPVTGASPSIAPATARSGATGAIPSPARKSCRGSCSPCPPSGNPRSENGLRLIVHEDHKAPIVTVNVWYDVGAADEAPGKTAYARACRSSASTHRSKSGIQADQRFPARGFRPTPRAPAAAGRAARGSPADAGA